MKENFILLNAKRVATAIVAASFAFSLASCDREQPKDTPKEEAKHGMDICIDMIDSSTGLNTRLVSNDKGYSFTKYLQGNGDVQVKNAESQPVEDSDKEQPVTFKLTYHAKQNIVFQGWRWRYEDDPKGTHRSSDGTKKLDDFIKGTYT